MTLHSYTLYSLPWVPKPWWFQNHENSKHFQNDDNSKPFFPRRRRSRRASRWPGHSRALGGSSQRPPVACQFLVSENLSSSYAKLFIQATNVPFSSCFSNISKLPLLLIFHRRSFWSEKPTWVSRSLLTKPTAHSSACPDSTQWITRIWWITKPNSLPGITKILISMFLQPPACPSPTLWTTRTRWTTRWTTTGRSSCSPTATTQTSSTTTKQSRTQTTARWDFIQIQIQTEP